MKRSVAGALAGLCLGPAAPALAQSVTTYTYDPLGRVTAVSHPGGGAATYAYDAADNRTSLTSLSASGSGTEMLAADGTLDGAPQGNGVPSCRAARVLATTAEHTVPVRAYCTDPDGDELRVMSASTSTPGASVVVNLDQTVTVFGLARPGEVAFSFAVQDAASAAAGALTVVRPEQTF